MSQGPSNPATVSHQTGEDMLTANRQAQTMTHHRSARAKPPPHDVLEAGLFFIKNSGRLGIPRRHKITPIQEFAYAEILAAISASIEISSMPGTSIPTYCRAPRLTKATNKPAGQPKSIYISTLPSAEILTRVLRLSAASAASSTGR